MGTRLLLSWIMALCEENIDKKSQYRTLILGIKTFNYREQH